MKSYIPTTQSLGLIVMGLLIITFTMRVEAQLLGGEEFPVEETGITPSQVQFNANPGATQSRTVEVFNNSPQGQTYQVRYQDFELAEDGQPRLLEPGVSPRSLQDVISVDPERLFLAPGEKGEIRLTVSLPEGETSDHSAWGMITIEPGNGELVANASQKPEGTGLTSSVAYSVWLCQNPQDSQPELDITNFIVGNNNRNKGVFLKVRNKGDGISVCNAFVEITNLKTGEQILIQDRQYTLLPGDRRTLMFDLEETLPKGSYSAVGRLNYENEEELVATELEFKID